MKIRSVIPFRIRDESDRTNDLDTAADFSSFDPVDSCFNIVSELSMNRQLYIGGDSTFSLSGLPLYIDYCFERINEAVSGTVYVSSIVTCCVVKSLENIVESREVREMMKQKRRLNKISEEVREDLAVVIHAVLKNIPLLVPSDFSGYTKVSMRISEDVMVNVKRFSRSIGMSASALMVMCIMKTLVDQSCILPKHSKFMAVGIKAFTERLRLQNAVARALVGELGRKN